MILRRLAGRLRQQDWLAVTIELVLVMVGVFLGIQVANWNEERKARSTEAAYLERIAQDARRDIAQLDEIIRATQGAHNALLDLEHLEDEELERYRKHYAALARSALARLRSGELDTDSPEIKLYAKR